MNFIIKKYFNILQTRNLYFFHNRLPHFQSFTKAELPTFTIKSSEVPEVYCINDRGKFVFAGSNQNNFNYVYEYDKKDLKAGSKASLSDFKITKKFYDVDSNVKILVDEDFIPLSFSGLYSITYHVVGSDPFGIDSTSSEISSPVLLPGMPPKGIYHTLDYEHIDELTRTRTFATVLEHRLPKEYVVNQQKLYNRFSPYSTKADLEITTCNEKGSIVLKKEDEDEDEEIALLIDEYKIDEDKNFTAQLLAGMLASAAHVTYDNGKNISSLKRVVTYGIKAVGSDKGCKLYEMDLDFLDNQILIFESQELSLCAAFNYALSML